jgi:hypothetical protein
LVETDLSNDADEAECGGGPLGDSSDVDADLVKTVDGAAEDGLWLGGIGFVLALSSVRLDISESDLDTKLDSTVDARRGTGIFG